ncbi:hypothetical protein [Streptomyces sp. JW3]|uniref:hypothetical protein n=1 Tax=Streptomyces sp. JW3 TaxID=3456955 RepID=UPI003FA48656
MESFKRSVRELPGDPRQLTLEYHSWEYARREDDLDGLDEWSVSVRLRRPGDRDAGAAVGSMTFFRLRQDERFSPWPWSDAERDGADHDLFQLVLGVYDLGRGGYRQEFRDSVTSADGDLLALYDITLDKAWRGFGLGPVLACQAVWALAGGCSAVTVATHVSEQLTGLWEDIGFRRCVRPLGHLLDPRSAEAREPRNEQRRKFDALADAYHAALRG